MPYNKSELKMPPQTNITPKKLCRISGHIFPKFSRMQTTIHLFSSNGALEHPYFTPKKFMSHFRTHFPQILSHRNQRKAEVIPGRQVASLLLIYARTV